MRLLLAESVPVRLRRSLAEHDVSTVVDEGWSGVRNGELLQRAAAAGFDVFVTVDKNLPHQQNVARLPVAVVVLDAPSSELACLLALVPKLKQVLTQVTPRTLVVVR